MDKQTRILFTIPNFKTAGSKYVLLGLYEKLDKRLFNPFICVEKFPETIPENIPEEKRLLFSFNNQSSKEILAFRTLLKKYKIDIVHSWDYKSNFLEALACRLAGVKYVYTKKNNAWSKRWHLKSLMSNHIAYDNPEMKNRFFKNRFLSNKTTFIPHGVDVEIFKPLPKLERRTFNIVNIGNIVPNKNQLFIIQSLLSLPENIVLHIYGTADKDYKKALDKFIDKNNLNKRVHFHGYIKNNHIPEVLRNIDLFILSSLQEGLPVSILEAMACGVMVLSSDSGGGARYLLEDEEIFSLEDTRDLESKILQIYNMDADVKLEKNNKSVDKIRNKYDSIAEVLAYESLYQKLLLK